MPRAIDLSTVSPERAAKLLKQRRQKADEYQRRREILLARNKAWRDANPGKVTDMHRDRAKANPERKSATRRASYDRNREATLARRSADNQSLVDSVVKARFVCRTGLQSQDVPPELVPVIRATLLIRRELKKARTK